MPDKILYLGPRAHLCTWLQEQGENVTQTSDNISDTSIDVETYSYVVSYGYRHILKQNFLDKFPNRAINLHISYLPWNRGADPNFWSFVQNTPKGVSIHYLDSGIDTGDIIAQKELKFDSKTETLATTYEKLHTAIQELFKQHWSHIKNGSNPRQRQSGEGSFHKLKDKEPLLQLLSDGWNTPIAILEKNTAIIHTSEKLS